MKKLILSAAAFTMLLASCAKDEAAVANGEALVTFNVAAEQIATRVYGDGVTAHNLKYAIYEKDDYAQPLIQKDIAAAFPENTMSTSFTEKLVKGKTYVALFWADAENTPYTIEWKEKPNVKITDPTALTSQDENLDAFFKCKEIVVGQDAQTETIELRRPFAQLNIGTADTADAATAGLTVSQTEVSVRAYTTLYLLNGEAADAMMLTYGMNGIPTDPNATFVVYGKTYDHLSMNYLLVGPRELVDVTFTVNDGKQDINTSTYAKVPVQRNHKTFIIGDLLTSAVDFEVIIKPEWDKPDYIYLHEPATVSSFEELQNTLQPGIAGDIVFDGDIINSSNNEDDNAAIEAVNSNVNIYGQGNSSKSGDANDYGYIANGGELNLYDINITSNGGGVGATNGAQVTVNNCSVYVDTASTSGRYIFYAAGAGTTITINGGSYSWDPADNQKRAYVYADAGTTVYINGGTFGEASKRSGYTTGILGTGEVIITGGTFGFDPSAWVAAGYQAVKSGTVWTVSAL